MVSWSFKLWGDGVLRVGNDVSEIAGSQLTIAGHHLLLLLRYDLVNAVNAVVVLIM